MTGEVPAESGQAETQKHREKKGNFLYASVLSALRLDGEVLAASRSSQDQSDCLRWEGLFCLLVLDVRDQVCDALLYRPFMPLAEAGEQRSPDWHVLAAMRRSHRLAAKHGGYMRGRVFPAVFPCQSR